MSGHVLALSGGIGGAKLSLGLAHVLGDELIVVANTGDDFEHLGLHISPDLDTLMYTLAGVANPETGWGRADESWLCMESLAELGGDTWFRLGDRDLAVHLYRTAGLRRGGTLAEITRELALRLGCAPLVLPMCDESVMTMVETDEGLLPFQEYFVRRGCRPRVAAVRFAGADAAVANREFLDAMRSPRTRAIIICPSNPYLSIDPILAVPGVRTALATSPAPVVAVSPIVGGRALKGPAAKVMAELGIPVGAEAVADHYRGLVDGLVIDTQDANSAGGVEAAGMACHVTNTVMRTLDDRISLARDVLEFAAQFAHRRRPDAHVDSDAV